MNIYEAGKILASKPDILFPFIAIKFIVPTIERGGKITYHEFPRDPLVYIAEQVYMDTRLEFEMIIMRKQRIKKILWVQRINEGLKLIAKRECDIRRGSSKIRKNRKRHLE